MDRKRLTHHNMFRRHSGTAILDDNSRATDTAAIAGNVDSTVMVVGENAHKFAEASRSSELSKLANKSSRIFGEANNSAIYVDHVGVGPVNLRSSRTVDIWYFCLCVNNGSREKAESRINQ